MAEPGGGPPVLGIDVGGTKIAAFRVDERGGVRDRAQVPTPADADAILEALGTLASSLRTDAVVGVGVGAAGMVDFAGGVLRYAPNLPWREIPLPKPLR